jgi:hypothetical protein
LGKKTVAFATAGCNILAGRLLDAKDWLGEK